MSFFNICRKKGPELDVHGLEVVSTGGEKQPRCQGLRAKGSNMGRAIMANKGRSIAVVGALLVTLGLLLATFAIPQTSGAMKHMWSKVGNAFATKQAYAIYPTAVLGGIIIGGVAYKTGLLGKAKRGIQSGCTSLKSKIDNRRRQRLYARPDNDSPLLSGADGEGEPASDAE